MLVTPDLIEQAAITCLHENHRRHLAALERQLALPVRAIEPLSTIDLLADDDQRLQQDMIPALLLTAGDLRDTGLVLRDDGRESLDMTWSLELHVFAIGGGRDPRSDAMRRCRWYWMTAVECLLTRLPGTERVAHLELTAARHETVGDSPFLAHAEVTIDVTADDCLTTSGGPLIVEDPADQYVAPTPGQAANDLLVDVTRNTP